MKKIIALFLAVLMILCFAACGDSESDVVTKKPKDNGSDVTEAGPTDSKTTEATVTDTPVVTTEKTEVPDEPEKSDFLVGNWIVTCEIAPIIKAGFVDNPIFSSLDIDSFLLVFDYTFDAENYSVALREGELDKSIIKLYGLMKAATKDYLYKSLKDIADPEGLTVDEVCIGTYGKGFEDYFENDFLVQYNFTEDAVKEQYYQSFAATSGSGKYEFIRDPESQYGVLSLENGTGFEVNILDESHFRMVNQNIAYSDYKYVGERK
ncbi:MAG: hypothetical protein J5850_00405 [Clostridia bacterium]|nr:hypothetical protein [Clostridia bacterium]